MRGYAWGGPRDEISILIDATHQCKQIHKTTKKKKKKLDPQKESRKAHKSLQEMVKVVLKLDKKKSPDGE